MNNSISILRSWFRRIILSTSSIYDSSPVTANSNSVSSQTTSSNSRVIFRFDDIPYDVPENRDMLIGAELDVMDLFIKKNQKMSLALVANYLDESPMVVRKIKEGLEKNLFELAIHGWEHSDFTKLNEVQQRNLLLNANNKIEHVFGKGSQVFIPPYNNFNYFTLQSMKKLGISVLSSELDLDESYIFRLKKYQNQGQKQALEKAECLEREYQNNNNKNASHGVYHMPQMTSYDLFKRTRLFKVPIKRIIKEIDLNVSKYGYAVITMHPQSFIKSMDGVFTSDIDNMELDKIENLIEMIISKNIKTATFSSLRDSSNPF